MILSNIPGPGTFLDLNIYPAMDKICSNLPRRDLLRVREHRASAHSVLTVSHQSGLTPSFQARIYFGSEFVEKIAFHVL